MVRDAGQRGTRKDRNAPAHQAEVNDTAAEGGRRVREGLIARLQEAASNGGRDGPLLNGAVPIAKGHDLGVGPRVQPLHSAKGVRAPSVRISGREVDAEDFQRPLSRAVHGHGHGAVRRWPLLQGNRDAGGREPGEDGAPAHAVASSVEVGER
eukprot:13487760-Alexandrium_andersonii.AAC.1